MSSLEGRTLSHYRVLAEVSRGGMGVVYRALDLKLNREVAVKVLPPELLANVERRRRFVQEAQAAAALLDSRIAVIHEIDEDDGVTFIAMELVRGEQLSDLLKRGPLPLARALELGIEIAEGLARAHEKGIVHRDLKPANVMVSEDGHTKIIDFGLAKLVEPIGDADTEAGTAARWESLTEAGVVMGTASYMSPEQARGHAVDPRTDLFSFGIVLYEMLTGAPPFHGPSRIDTLAAIVNDSAPALGRAAGDVADQLQVVLDKCLAKDREKRYQGVPELLQDLRAIRALVEPTAPSLPVLALQGHAERRRRRLRIALWLGAAVVALLAAGYVFRGSLPRMVGAPRIRSIVALPSRVHAVEADSFLTDAIPNTISTQLSQVQGLETKLPPTRVDFDRVGGDLAKLAEVYGVGAFVLSSVTVQANRFVLNVQLVEAGSRRLLWSREYDGTREAYLQLVREAAEGVRQAVRAGSAPVPSAAVASASSEVELLLQRGAHHLSRHAALYRPEDAERARAAFQHALQLDPTRAEAAAGVAVVLLRRVQIGDAGVRADMESWARKALALDSRSSEAWVVLSHAEQLRKGGSARTALEYALKAAALGRQRPLASNSLGHKLLTTSIGLALEAYREAWRLDPLYLNAGVSATTILDLQGREVEALRIAEQVLRLEPEAPLGLMNKARFLAGTGRRREQLEILGRLQTLAAGRRLNADWLGITRDVIELESADTQAAQAARERLLKTAAGEARFPSWEIFSMGTAVLLARLDQDEMAVEALTRMDAAGVVLPYDVLRQNPRVLALLVDPRLKGLETRSRASFVEAIGVLEQARSRGDLPAYLERPLTELRALAAAQATSARRDADDQRSKPS